MRKRKELYYFIGDTSSETGPAIVNKNIIKQLHNFFIRVNTQNRLFRLLHFLLYFLKTRKVLISGLSKFNLVAIRISNFFKVETIYLMHGYATFEDKFENRENMKIFNLEDNVLNEVSKVICVSEMFMDKMKNIYPEIRDKFHFINNGVEYYINKKNVSVKKNKYRITCIGSLSHLKNILTVCKAIEITKNKDIVFTIIGSKGLEYDEIIKYDFVKHFEHLPHTEVLKELYKTDLYIQNSRFETFGLGVIEAISQGCNILISHNIGAINIIENLEESNIIRNVDNVDEIFQKISYIISVNKRSTVKINYNNYSWEQVCNELLKFLRDK